MKSVMVHSFSQVPNVSVQRSVFDRTHGHKTSFNSGDLIPFLVDEALPGDTFTCQAHLYARLATPIYPIMDNMFMETHFFAVPLRLIWTNFPKFMGEQVNPGDSTSYVVPTMTAPGGGYAEGSLHDYMGIPTKIANIAHSALFFRAYNLVWNQWFRDENMQNSAVVDLDDGPDLYTDYTVKKRGKRHDYFTSCLPWPQKGTAVSVSLGTTAPVTGSVATTTIQSDGNSLQVRGSTGAMTTITLQGSAGGAVTHTSATNNAAANFGAAGATTTGLRLAGATISGSADLTAATAMTMNDLRLAMMTQKLLELDARGGTRYVEMIKAHFGVQSPDFRVQRSEFLGGGRSYVNINQVAQSSATSGQPTPLGTMSAYGVVSGGHHGFTKSFTEHCIILGFVSVRADLTYQQGLDRMFKRSTRYDFFWPVFAGLGEQAVKRGEIYADGTANDDIVFGYQERYGEYRYKNSRISGLFRSNATGTLHGWHLSQLYGAAPTLGDTFIKEDPPMSRVKAVAGQPDFLFDSYISMRCVRPMPMYGVPSGLSRF